MNTGGAVINRNTDSAMMDNAYALSGPREVAMLMLSFEDGSNLATVWTASISQMVENQNQANLNKAIVDWRRASQKLSEVSPTPDHLASGLTINLGIRTVGQPLTNIPV